MAQGFRTPAAAGLRCCIASRPVVPRLDCAAACSCERTQFSEIKQQCMVKFQQDGCKRASLECRRLNTFCSSQILDQCPTLGTRGPSTHESSFAVGFADAFCSLKLSTTTILPYAPARALGCSSTSSICGLSMRHGDAGISHGAGSPFPRYLRSWR